MVRRVLSILLSYRVKMVIRDLFLRAGNPFQIVSFSPQHKRLYELSPFEVVVHVGADTGQESVFYEFIKSKKVLWIEANPETFEILLRNTRKRRRSTQFAANALVSSTNDNILELNLFSLSGANSVYLPTSEFLSLNERRFLTGKKLMIETATLPKVLESFNFSLQNVGCNLLVIDVEGHELEVLKGCSAEFLSSFDYIMCEVSKHVRHVGAASFSDITSYLKDRGFLIDFEGPREIFDDVIYKRQTLEP